MKIPSGYTLFYHAAGFVGTQWREVKAFRQSRANGQLPIFTRSYSHLPSEEITEAQFQAEASQINSSLPGSKIANS